MKILSILEENKLLLELKQLFPKIKGIIQKSETTVIEPVFWVGDTTEIKAHNKEVIEALYNGDIKRGDITICFNPTVSGTKQFVHPISDIDSIVEDDTIISFATYLLPVLNEDNEMIYVSGSVDYTTGAFTISEVDVISDYLPTLE